MSKYEKIIDEFMDLLAPHVCGPTISLGQK
jgi:hypothetical protein